MPSPMQPIADQNIAFGRRADADIKAVAMAAKSIRGYKLPPSSLLYRSEEHVQAREEQLLEEAKVLVEKCGEFGVDGNVTQINPGPVVTTFEFKPDSGVKYSRVTGLADDLCLAMAAESILIERMAGKSTVGIQVPNHERETIWLRDVVECESFAQSKGKLAIALGKDINGRIVTGDLASMPHVLIAGSTGSGKSVAINAMIMSVLFKSTPEQVRMILVDPKRVELGMYEGIPHLFTPIITEAKLAANALRNAVREMERRLKLLAANHVRNIDQFNKLFEHGSDYLFEDVNQEPLPYIMIIIDELADLMMLDRANVEEAITRLAQMARAVGIHLVLATQRPSVDVITGLIKANVPTRMSFRLGHQSRFAHHHRQQWRGEPAGPWRHALPPAGDVTLAAYPRTVRARRRRSPPLRRSGASKVRLNMPKASSKRRRTTRAIPKAAAPTTERRTTRCSTKR